MRPPRFALVLVVVMAAGCGGDGGGSESESFAAEANAACKKRIDAIDAAVDGSKQAEDSDAAIVDAYDTELETLQDLDAPSKDENAYATMLRHYEDGTKSVHEFADKREEAAKATDRDTYNDLVTESGEAMTASRRARTRGNHVAEDIGLETCATPLY
jgi:hypothetical protein